MNVMDRLFERYKAEFDRVERNVRQLNRKLGAPQSDKMWATRLTREQFDEFLGESAPDSEAKRLFMEQLLEGQDGLRPSLPEHLNSLLASPSLDSLAQRQSVV